LTKSRDIPTQLKIRKRFLDPLQLTNTYYELNEPPRGERAHGLRRLSFAFR